ncbi:MAG TPA: protein kinase [Thermoanaerobaculia bacterium]|nr:protein kinase [Thermoanaerobaculia bacterium]
MTDKRRTGLSLGTRLLLAMAMVVLLGVGAAVAAVYLRGQALASTAVEEALARSAVAVENSQEQHKQQLKQLSRTFADATLVAYLAEGAATAQESSILDLLELRQNDLGFDFAAVLGPDGRVVARTDRPGSAGQDLAERPLVAATLKSNQPTVGVWPEEDALYNAVVVPMVTGFDLVGYVAFGFRIDQAVARDLSEISGTEVVFLAVRQGKFEALPSSTLETATAQDLSRSLVRLDPPSALARGEGRRVSLNLDGRPWLAQVTPLLEAPGQAVGAPGQVVGATLALASLDRQLGPFRTLLRDLVIAGLAATLLALGLAYALSNRMLRPIRRLVASAEAARGGDFGQRVVAETSDEVGQLARSFNELLADLREKSDMQAYLTDLSRTLPEPGKAALPVEGPQKKSVTLVAVELRRYVRAAAQPPDEVVARLNRDLRRAAAAVAARRGRLVSLLGHRLLAAFEGEDRSVRAVAAASEMMAALGSREDAFDDLAEPLVVLAGGEVITGTASLGEDLTASLLGLPVQKLESLLKEATVGEMVLSKEVQRDLEDLLARTGFTPESHQGVVTTLPFFSLKSTDAVRIAGVVTPAVAPTLAMKRSALLADLGPGKLLGGRFEVLAQLGAGGMGMVFKARDRELDDLVALKVLRREAWQDPVQLERLKEELRLARKITHPNVLRTYDFGELDGIHFISMEYVRGVTLRYMLDQTDRLPFSAALRVGKQLLSGLAAAHQQGVLHRDIKPDNLILDPAGNAKLMDFGIARPIARAGLGLTQEGWLVGTPQYMAPEALQGQEVDARTDLYAVGVLLYEVFTGRLPFTGQTPVEIAFKHLNETPPAPRALAPSIPEVVEGILLRCLAKSPADRFPSAESLLASLDALSA